MIHRNGNDVQMGHLERFTDGNGNVLHHWAIVVLQVGKARIEVPVKNVTLEQSDDLLRCVDAHRLFQTRIKIVDKNRQARDVVHVRMRHDYVSDFGALLVVQSDGDTAGVNRNAVVDDKTCQALLKGRHSLSVEGAG